MSAKGNAFALKLRELLEKHTPGMELGEALDIMDMTKDWFCEHAKIFEDYRLQRNEGTIHRVSHIEESNKEEEAMDKKEQKGAPYIYKAETAMKICKILNDYIGDSREEKLDILDIVIKLDIDGPDGEFEIAEK